MGVTRLLAVSVPAACDGASLTGHLRGSAPPSWREEAHFEFDFRNLGVSRTEPPLGLGREQCSVSALRGERYKYVHFSDLPSLLFDLEADPNEFENLAMRPEHHQTTLACAQRLLSWRMHHTDRTLANLETTPNGLRSNGTSAREQHS